jgi:iron-sulfur cluster insertion protein
MQHKFHIDPSAAKRIKELQVTKDNPDLGLRIRIDGGGCSGFQYLFEVDDQIHPHDLTFESDGATVIIDDMSINMINGGTVKFVENLMGQFFEIDNPKATTGCGCGSSFSTF